MNADAPSAGGAHRVAVQVRQAPDRTRPPQTVLHAYDTEQQATLCGSAVSYVSSTLWSAGSAGLCVRCSELRRTQGWE